MNIVYLHSHDTGRAIQPYGAEFSTPALQNLADTGALFLNAHCAAPTCSPSRAALLTGQTAHGAGMVGLSHRGGVLNYPERHLANFLKTQGFETAIAGIQHVGVKDEKCGYQKVVRPVSGNGESIRDAALSFLDAYESNQPFFLDVGFNETHRRGFGFNPDHNHPGDGDGDPASVEPPVFLGAESDVARDWKDLGNAVERLDSYYGQILDKLESKGLTDDTLVIATTDHGVAFPEMKCSLTSRGTGVLLIMRYPQKMKPGIRSEGLVSHLDVFPTICDLLGTPAPDWLEGESLCPILSGNEEAELHDFIFAEVTFHAAFEPKRSARSKKWNYVRNFASPHRPVLPNCDDGPTKQVWLNSGKFDFDVPAEELYDLDNDPLELKNLAEDPACVKIKQEMRSRLATWMKETDDPFLSSDPSVLPGPMQVNTWDQIQPASGDKQSEWDPELWKLIQPL